MFEQIAPVNVTSAAFKANPFPFYAQLRADAPVYRTWLPGGKHAWLITRYDDVAAVMKDERLVKDRQNTLDAGQKKLPGWMPATFRALDRNMLDLDAPDHTRLRGLVHKAFTPRLIEHMRERIQTITDTLLDRALERGEMDIVRDFALPLPVTVIAEMLGVPPADRDKFHKWSQAAVSSTPGSLPDMVRADPEYPGVRQFRAPTGEGAPRPTDG